MLNIDLFEKERLIQLEGLLEKNDGIEEALGRAFDRALAIAPDLDWAIDADRLQVDPSGVDLWIDLVKKKLWNTSLFYYDSQLAYILQYDSKYDHPETDYSDPLPEKPSYTASVGSEAESKAPQKGYTTVRISFTGDPDAIDRLRAAVKAKGEIAGFPVVDVESEARTTFTVRDAEQE